LRCKICTTDGIEAAGALVNAKLAVLEFNVFPPQAAQLARPQASVPCFDYQK